MGQLGGARWQLVHCLAIKLIVRWVSELLLHTASSYRLHSHKRRQNDVALSYFGLLGMPRVACRELRTERTPSYWMGASSGDG